MALPSILVAIAGDLACMMVKDYFGVCVLRALVGISGGLLSALYSAVLANSRSPGHIIAVTTFIQIGVEAAFMFSSASVLERLGGPGLFLLMAALFVALLPFLTLLPPKWPTAPATDPREPKGPQGSWRAYPLLLSFVPFIVGAGGGVHLSHGEFGRVAANLSVDETLHAIGISVVLSSLGSVAAYWLNDRIGLRLPIAGAMLLMTGMLFGMIFDSQSAALFLLYISLLQSVGIFLNCYLYSALIDANNLLVPAATPSSALGSVVGAGVMGYVLDHSGMIGSLKLTIGSMLLTALLTMPFLRPHPADRWKS